MTFAAVIPSDRVFAFVELAARIGVWMLLLAPCALVALMAAGFKASKPATKQVGPVSRRY
jgi:hypothetical protein